MVHASDAAGTLASAAVRRCGVSIVIGGLRLGRLCGWLTAVFPGRHDGMHVPLYPIATHLALVLGLPDTPLEAAKHSTRMLQYACVARFDGTLT